MYLPPESRAHPNGILTHTLQKCFLGRELVCFNFRVGIAPLKFVSHLPQFRGWKLCTMGLGLKSWSCWVTHWIGRGIVKICLIIFTYTILHLIIAWWYIIVYWYICILNVLYVQQKVVCLLACSRTINYTTRVFTIYNDSLTFTFVWFALFFQT